MNKPHVHKDVIIAWANGATIQYKIAGSDAWDDCAEAPFFCSDIEYRIKPEREYPVTSLSLNEIGDEWVQFTKTPWDGHFRVGIAIANLAIKNTF